MLAGIWGAAAGIGGMSGESAGTINVDSEYRFLSVLWVSYGLLALWAAPRATGQRGIVLGLFGVLFCAGLARALSWAAEGRPDTVYLVLLALELATPLLGLALLRVASPEQTKR